METYNAISTHINIDIVKAFDKAHDMSIKAIDILPIVAAPIFYLDDNEDLSKRAPVFSAVRTLKKRKHCLICNLQNKLLLMLFCIDG